MPLRRALTPQQWTEVVTSQNRGALRQKYANDPHAQAAVALYDQAFGFRDDHVEALRDAADVLEASGANAFRLRQVADLIEALLPHGTAALPR